MARKVTPTPATRSSASVKGADDLAVLHPDATVEIGERRITIMEYRFVSGMQVRAKAVQLVLDLKKQIESGSALVEEITNVLAAHQALVRELILLSIEGSDKEPARSELVAWMADLDDADGELLLLTWWGVCGPFFVRQITRRWYQQLQLDQDLAQQADGATSTHASPPPGTAAPVTSEPPTPSAS